MLDALTKWNRERQQRGRFPVHIGIGVSRGQVVAGNVGAPNRMDFTIIGQGVNLASRLEGACRWFGVSALVADDALRACTDEYPTREVGWIQPKGAARASLVQELLPPDSPMLACARLLDVFQEGRRAHDDGDLGAAAKSFEEVLRVDPSDGLASAYVERCRVGLDRRSCGGWDPTWVLAIS